MKALTKKLLAIVFGLFGFVEAPSPKDDETTIQKE
jgi:hypothetical protein